MTRIWPSSEAVNVEAVGYHDLNGNPGFKMAIQEVEGRWFLYLSHFWVSGWSVVDITEPEAPKYVRFVPGPPNTFTLQVQVADGLMIGSMQEIYIPGWGDTDATDFSEGIYIWDVKSDPENPSLLSHWETGSTGTHRNFYSGGRYLHLSAAMPGRHGHVYRVLDVSDPSAPTEVGNFSLDEQKDLQDGRHPYAHLHGGPYVVGERAYLPYSGAGLVTLDVSDPTEPTMVNQLAFPEAMGGKYAVHTAVPLPGRNLVVINSEMVKDDVAGPLPFAAIVDIADEMHPRIVSFFPTPIPGDGLPLRTYIERGGWFGPHNQHQPQGSPALEDRTDRVYLTYFNAGLRIYDISEERYPREIGCFVPKAPDVRRGPAPARLAVSSEDVIVDRRGFIYMTDKNLGVQVLRCLV